MKQINFLKQLESKEIVEIAKQWGIKVDDEKWTASKISELIHELEVKFQLEENFKTVYRSLSEQEKSCFLYITINGGSVDKEEVTARIFKKSNTDFKKSFELLFKKGLVCEDLKFSSEVGTEIVRVPNVFLEYVKLPFYFDYYVGKLLWELPTTSLKKIGIDGLKLSARSFTQQSLIYTIKKESS